MIGCTSAQAAGFLLSFVAVLVLLCVFVWILFTCVHELMFFVPGVIFIWDIMHACDGQQLHQKYIAHNSFTCICPHAGQGNGSNGKKGEMMVETNKTSHIHTAIERANIQKQKDKVCTDA